MGAAYLWVKAFHIVFVASWFAGLFYLPRIFVNLAGVAGASHAERERLLLMATRLYRFANLLMLFRSEEHTSELQSQSNLVCRLLLEKKKQRTSGPHRAA